MYEEKECRILFLNEKDFHFSIPFGIKYMSHTGKQLIETNSQAVLSFLPFFVPVVDFHEGLLFCTKKSLFGGNTPIFFGAHENLPCSAWLWALNLLFQWNDLSNLFFCAFVSVLFLFILPKKCMNNRNALSGVHSSNMYVCYVL